MFNNPISDIVVFVQELLDKIKNLTKENSELRSRLRELENTKISQNSIVKHQEHLFTFLEDPEVPSDNNASERAIRPLKIKHKVSGMFKSNDGGDNFSTLYSIAHTAIKNNRNPFDAVATYG